MVVVAGKTYTLDKDLTLNEELLIDGTFIFDPTKNVKLSISRKIILTGKLIMKPSSTSIHHSIEFISLDEKSDIGFVIKGGQLDLAGPTAPTGLLPTAKFEGSIVIDNAKGGSAYNINNAYKTATWAKKGTLQQGTNKIDVSKITSDTIYVYIDNIRIAKLAK